MKTSEEIIQLIEHKRETLITLRESIYRTNQKKRSFKTYK